jgi:hypothetical protein
MTRAILLRDAIAQDNRTFVKGMIMPWPADFALPPGMIWLREEVIVVGPDGAPQVAWGDLTAAALKIMQEVSAP